MSTMSTLKFALKNNYADLDAITDGWLNAVADDVDLLAELCELTGAGVFSDADFNGAAVPGQLAVSISPGAAIVGDAGNLLPARSRQFQTIQVPASTAGIRVYINQSGVATAVAPGNPAPAQSLLVFECDTNATEVVSINNAPAGRTNLTALLHAAQLSPCLAATIGTGPGLSVGQESGNAITVTVQARDAALNDIAERRLLRIWIAGAQYGAECASAPDGGVAVTTGTVISTVTANKQYLVLTDASGVVQITLTHSAAATFWLHAADGSRVSAVQVTFA